MSGLPLIRDTNPGIYQVCTNANTDYVLTVPYGCTSFVIWFETSTSVATMIRGRVGVDQANTTVTGLDGTDNKLGYHPPMPVEYDIETRQTTNLSGSPVAEGRDAYVHVANSTAGAVCRGMWLFQFDVQATV